MVLICSTLEINDTEHFSIIVVSYVSSSEDLNVTMDIMLCETARHRQTSTLGSHSYVESRRVHLIEVEQNGGPHSWARGGEYLVSDRR